MSFVEQRLWALGDAVEYWSNSNKLWVDACITGIDDDGVHADLNVKKGVRMDSLRNPQIGQAAPETEMRKEPTEDGFTISSSAGWRRHERDQERMYLETVRARFEEFAGTSERPHVSFSAALFDGQIEFENAHVYGDGAGQTDIVGLAGPAGQETASRIEAYAKNC